MALQFLAWQETDPRKPLVRRIAESCARFADRYGFPATVLRVHPTTVLPADLSLPVERTRLVPPGQVWPGADFAAPPANSGTDDAAADARAGGELEESR